MAIYNSLFDNKGQTALFIAVSISAILLYVGLHAMNRHINEAQALVDAENSLESFYLADTGTERFLYVLKTKIADGTYESMEKIADSFGGDTDISNGIGIVGDSNNNYKVEADGVVVKVTGTYRNVNRAIELTYGP